MTPITTRVYTYSNKHLLDYEQLRWSKNAAFIEAWARRIQITPIEYLCVAQKGEWILGILYSWIDDEGNNTFPIEGLPLRSDPAKERGGIRQILENFKDTLC